MVHVAADAVSEGPRGAGRHEMAAIRDGVDPRTWGRSPWSREEHC